MNWNAVIAVCTAIAAIFTAVMAWFTRQSIVESQKQHRDARQQSEQHHQDSLRPVLVLAPRAGIDQLDRSNLLWSVPVKLQETIRTFETPCVLRNIGTGPALNARLTLRFMGIDGYGIARDVAPLRAGGETDGSERHLKVQFRLCDGFNDADFQLACGMGWELLLEYEDVFGNHFHTIHCKNPQRPWTVCGKGTAPEGASRFTPSLGTPKGTA